MRFHTSQDVANSGGQARICPTNVAQAELRSGVLPHNARFSIYLSISMLRKAALGNTRAAPLC